MDRYRFTSTRRPRPNVSIINWTILVAPRAWDHMDATDRDAARTDAHYRIPRNGGILDRLLPRRGRQYQACHATPSPTLWRNRSRAIFGRPSEADVTTSVPVDQHTPMDRTGDPGHDDGRHSVGDGVAWQAVLTSDAVITGPICHHFAVCDRAHRLRYRIPIGRVHVIPCPRSDQNCPVLIDHSVEAFASKWIGYRVPFSKMHPAPQVNVRSDVIGDGGPRNRLSADGEQHGDRCGVDQPAAQIGRRHFRQRRVECMTQTPDA